MLDIVDTKQVFALEGKTYITEPTQWPADINVTTTDSSLTFCPS